MGSPVLWAQMTGQPCAAALQGAFGSMSGHAHRLHVPKEVSPPYQFDSGDGSNPGSFTRLCLAASRKWRS